MFFHAASLCRVVSRMTIRNVGRGFKTSLGIYGKAKPSHSADFVESFKPTLGYVTSIAVTEQGRVVAAENKKFRDSIEVRHEISRVNVYDAENGEVVGECESVDTYIDDPSSPRLVYPTSYHDVAVFENGNIAVKCKLYPEERDWAGCVGIFNPEGKFIKFLGERWVLNHGLAVNSKSQILLGVWDEEETPYRVCVYSESGKLKREIADDRFGPQMSLAVNANDDIVLADMDSGRLNIFDSDGKYLFDVKIRSHTGDKENQSDSMDSLSVCCDAQGNIFCADERSGKVHMISVDGRSHNIIVSERSHKKDALVAPKAIAVYDGGILVAESGVSNLVKMFKYM
ncbi:unnamed protein product [Owenia fusiformis]|uniref:Uncharacterized protein n=1 Tax=Owenia fusiformis TaxID=6347 RepID=A0A8J1T6S7_OWEFU|nr:unnamed protein product [Owenia fusiformis]